MAAVHFTTIPCKPYSAHKVQGKPYFCNVSPCANELANEYMLGLNMLALFCTFKLALLEFSSAKAYGKCTRRLLVFVRRIKLL